MGLCTRCVSDCGCDDESEQLLLSRSGSHSASQNIPVSLI